jgi:hypothetical protein
VLQLMPCGSRSGSGEVGAGFIQAKYTHGSCWQLLLRWVKLQTTNNCNRCYADRVYCGIGLLLLLLLLRLLSASLSAAHLVPALEVNCVLLTVWHLVTLQVHTCSNSRRAAVTITVRSEAGHLVACEVHLWTQRQAA